MIKFVYNNIDDIELRNKLIFMFVKKRMLDIVISFVALATLMPFLLLLAIVIKITSKGPVIYWQKRVGWDAKEFNFPKFRSMHTNADLIKDQLLDQNNHGSSAVTFKIKNDPRVTPVGKFIRKYSIDELPQLWCVLKGDMSLVGPRPPLPSEVSKYTAESKMRLMIIPGLTGIWQVSGRGDVGFEEQVYMDLMYIAHYSFRLDLQILWKTFFSVIKGDGAY